MGDVDGRREALEAAFDAVAAREAGDAPAPPAEPAAAPEPPAAPAAAEPAAAAGADGDGAGPARDDRGRFAGKRADTSGKPGNVEAKPPSGPRSPAVPPPAGVQPKDAAPPGEPPPPTLKAPPNWTPRARERWASLPLEVQQEALRVDADTKRALAEASEERKYARAVRDVLGPFEGMIRAEGAEPLNAVRDLLQFSHALRTAPPAHKAQLVAHLVRTFGVDIQALDHDLANGGPAAGSQAAPQALRDPRLDTLIAEIQQAKASREQAMATRAQADVEAFEAKHEFFGDVRETMQKLLRAGIANGLEDAYSQAVALTPGIQETLQQRKAAEAAKAATASTQRALAAASSVKSKPAGTAPDNGKPRTRLSDLEAAWEAHSGR